MNKTNAYSCTYLHVSAYLFRVFVTDKVFHITVNIHVIDNGEDNYT